MGERESLEIMSPRDVERDLDLDQVTIWRLRRRGEFPEPIRLSPGRKGYLRTDIRAWLASRSRG